MGWEKNKPCFVKIKLSKKIPMKFLNTSAKNIKNKKKLSYFKKYIINFEKLDINKNLTTAIITPDKEIVENANKLSPAYLVFDNFDENHFFHFHMMHILLLLLCLLRYPGFQRSLPPRGSAVFFEGSS